MRATWLTDIHLNFVTSDALGRFLDEVADTTGDVVLISGDIGEGDSVVHYLERIESAVERPVYFVLGNHDFYGSSIARVRADVAAFAGTSKHATWLNRCSHVSLTSHTALVGHDSWADGRLGRFETSSVELNDFYNIEELTGLDRRQRLRAMQQLADEAAAHFERVLPRALSTHHQVVLITHAPPFREATWHEGRISDDDWLPFLSAQAVGDVLRDVMTQHPESRLTVLCGHTHGRGQCDVLPNLRVYTGGAVYFRPEVQTVPELL